MVFESLFGEGGSTGQRQTALKKRASLLDHSLLLYGSGMGDPNVHDHQNLPILVAGGAAGNMRGGRHLKFTQPVAMANLHLTLLNKVGVKRESFADSNGLLGMISRLHEVVNVVSGITHEDHSN